MFRGVYRMLPEPYGRVSGTSRGSRKDFPNPGPFPVPSDMKLRFAHEPCKGPVTTGEGVCRRAVAEHRHVGRDRPRGRSLGTDCFESAQRPRRRRPGTRSRVEELLLRHGYRRRRGRGSPSPLIDLVFHELESAWAMEVIRGVENVAREEGLSRRALRERRAGSPPARPGSTACWPAARRRDPGALRARRGPARPADQPRHPVRGDRPGRRPGRRRALDRRHQLAGRAGRHPPPGRARPPPDRRDQRAGADDVQPGPDRRLPGRAWRPRGCRSTPPWSGTATSTTRPATARAWSCCACPTRPPPSSPATTCRRSASTRPPASWACASREDLSVVGFDDLPLARWVGPPLTTVRQPLIEMAEAAARLVLDLGRGQQPSDHAGGPGHQPGGAQQHGGPSPLTSRPTRGPTSDGFTTEVIEPPEAGSGSRAAPTTASVAAVGHPPTRPRATAVRSRRLPRGQGRAGATIRPRGAVTALPRGTAPFAHRAILLRILVGT